jgi:MOSC domain-containing protein
VRTVARISITPVKSLGLHHPDEIRLETFGVAENRRFYVAEPDGSLVNGADFGPLVAVRAEYRARDDGHGEWLSLRFPDQSTVEGDPCHIGATVETDFFGRSARGSILEGPWAAALTTYAGRPLILARCGQPGDANDSAPVSIFSTASAEELARRSGSGRALDARRFRMLLEVAGSRPHEEDEWVGSPVRIGAALVRVLRPVSRCVITTQDPSTGFKDFETLKAIAAYRGLREGRKIDFGVYADVLEAGPIRVGDPVEPVGS